jgi:hypothetical protein
MASKRTLIKNPSRAPDPEVKVGRAAALAALEVLHAAAEPFARKCSAHFMLVSRMKGAVIWAARRAVNNAQRDLAAWELANRTQSNDPRGVFDHINTNDVAQLRDVFAPFGLTYEDRDVLNALGLDRPVDFTAEAKNAVRRRLMYGANIPNPLEAYETELRRLEARRDADLAAADDVLHAVQTAEYKSTLSPDQLPANVLSEIVDETVEAVLDSAIGAAQRLLDHAESVLASAWKDVVLDQARGAVRAARGFMLAHGFNDHKQAVAADRRKASIAAQLAKLDEVVEKRAQAVSSRMESLDQMIQTRRDKAEAEAYDEAEAEVEAEAE